MFRLASYNQVQGERNSEFDHLYHIMDRAFANEPSKELVRGFNVDIQDQEENYVFEADLPGIKKEDIKVDYTENNLILKVEVNEEDKSEINYIRRERNRSSMKRVFRVKDIQKDAISATFENGVLTVIAPKIIEEDTTINIEIK